jgi:hypothetical protein
MLASRGRGNLFYCTTNNTLTGNKQQVSPIVRGATKNKFSDQKIIVMTVCTCMHVCTVKTDLKKMEKEKNNVNLSIKREILTILFKPVTCRQLVPFIGILHYRTTYLLVLHLHVHYGLANRLLVWALKQLTMFSLL